MKFTQCFGLVAFLGLASESLGALDPSRYLWYTHSAQDWETGVLPIGNGRLGATVWGGGNEVVTLTENSIWSGPLQDRTPANALKALSTARSNLIAGNITETGRFIMREMMGVEKSERQFSYFGNLNLAFGHSGTLENYTRWLDTKRGNVGVSYTFHGVQYTREYIASYPAGVVAARFTASTAGALGLTAGFSRMANVLTNVASVSGSVNSIKMTGSSGQATSPILFTGQANFVSSDATFAVSGSNLVISGATTIDVFFNAETNYRYASATNRDTETARKVTAAVSQGFNKVKDDALADTAALLDRSSLYLGVSPSNSTSLPTDERITNARGALYDLELVTLAWNYGRHLLVASSRETSSSVDMPANLQGIWNNKTSAAWGGKYTININTEMNYWPAGQTNLLETQPPLFDLMAVANVRGKKLATDMYDCGGTVFHHNLDLWGDPAPTDNYTSSSMWPMGAAWLVQHMMDHYRFTGDKTFLQNTAYPFLTDVATFYKCYTFDWQGFKTTGPSLSPENIFYVPTGQLVAGSGEAMDIGIAMDNQLMYDVFSSIIEAAAVLGVSSTDADLVAAKAFLPKIRPPQIGSLGGIMEWRADYSEVSKGHRHFSPLYALHPGKQFSPLLNATLSKAAGVLLDRRRTAGSGSTGWSNSWMINLYARLNRGSDAWDRVRVWFSKYPLGNLWNTDSGSTFQIDGNFGLTSGITEMLLQSHAGVVHLLPALPSVAVPSGNVKGLKARGNFNVDIEWSNGVFKSAAVTSNIGGQLALRVQGGTAFYVNGVVYTAPITTTQNTKYAVTLG